MSEDIPSPPSARRLARTALVAIVVAGAVLITVVLPVEYGVDPLRTGAALGLVRQSIDEAASVDPNTAAKLLPTLRGPIAYYAGAYFVDRAEFELGPYEFLEYKYRLEQGASMQFAWEASAEVSQDFHGVPDTPASNADKDKEVSFDKSNRKRGFGAHVAPFAGMHGWYWENEGAEPVTIAVTSAGFYTLAVETRSNRSKRTHELKQP